MGKRAVVRTRDHHACHRITRRADHPRRRLPRGLLRRLRHALPAARDYRIHTGLACTTLVKDGMSLTQIPAVPMEKAIYDLEQIEPTVDTIKKYYPAIFRCVSCNTCTKTARRAFR